MLLLVFSLLPMLVSCVVEGDPILTFVRLNRADPVQLECEGEKISWKQKFNESSQYEDVEIDEMKELGDGGLSLKKIDEQDLVIYACFDDAGTKIKEFELTESFRLKKSAKSVQVELGSSSTDKIKCTLLGEHEVLFRWFKRPEGSEPGSKMEPICGVKDADGVVEDECVTPEPEPEESKKKEEPTTTTIKPFVDRISIDRENVKGVVSSILKIENAQMEDRAVYICQAIAIELVNEREYDCEDSTYCVSEETLLRVKDPLAAIWPFAGIVAEVVILCLVIFICERRKKAEDQDDDDDQGYKGNNVSSNNSLRQRK